MGGMFSYAWDSFFGPYRYKVTMIGLDFAGKTSILFRLSLGDIVTTSPTVGCNVDTVKYKNIEFQCWDLGGSLREVWSNYYVDTNAIILVIDSSDRERMSVVKSELQKILEMECLQNASLLIYANKQDIPGAQTPVEIVSALDLTEVKRPFHVQGASALSGDGLPNGIEWLAGQLTK